MAVKQRTKRQGAGEEKDDKDQYLTLQFERWGIKIVIPITKKTIKAIKKRFSKNWPWMVGAFIIVVVLYFFVCLSLHLNCPLCSAASKVAHLPPNCPYQATTDQETILQIINAEGDASVGKKIEIIKNIFASTAVIIDYARGITYTDPISRYTDLFGTTTYISASHYQIQPAISIQGDLAYYTSGSKGKFTYNGVTYEYDNPPGSDHWTLERINGCWRITKLSFNALAAPFPP